MSTRELIGLIYSPWTEKARWALQHHRLPYDYTEHLMIFGMPALRWKMRKPFGDVTVPALIDRASAGGGGKTVRLGDSWDIALHAETLGQGSPLFPREKFVEIERLNALSESALCAERALIIDRTRRDPATQLELLPPFVPASLRRPLRFVANAALDYIEREFRTDAKEVQAHENDLRDVLTELRRLIAGANHEGLLGDFSYGDIAMAVTLHFVSPPEPEFMKIGPATRASWTNPTLAREFADVVAWRDEIYRKYRRR